MARIRTIKPEFFTSEDIVNLSPLARLLYIATWCEADKEGRMTWKPMTFKLRYLPADNCDIKSLCQELIDAGLIVLYGEGLAYIPGFSRHQHINPRESTSTLPLPKEVDACLRVGTREYLDLTHREEGKGREGKGNEEIPSLSKSSISTVENQSSKKQVPPCPFDTLIDIYETNLPNLPSVTRSLFQAGANGKATAQRWKWVMTSTHEKGSRKGERIAATTGEALAWFNRFFAFVATSDFLSGRNGEWTGCSLGWLMTLANFEKVLAGNYVNKEWQHE